MEVPVPVLVGSREEADLVGELGDVADRLAGRFWPGGLTLVVPRTSRFDVDLGGSSATRASVGVRWPDHPVVTRLCRLVGPLAVTSANLHGTPPATTALHVASQFPASGSVALVLDGGVCDRPPSTVVDCTGPDIRCLREGTVDWELISGCALGPSGRTER
jgi:L-threonylcarbamoyladenylate synthase